MASNRGISAEHWDKLLESFRARPSGMTAASRAAKVAVNTAKKAWLEGMPHLGKGPIKAIVEEEQRAARATMADVQRTKAAEQAEANADRAWKEAEKARRDVVMARKQEAELVRAERANVIALVGSTGRLLRGLIRRCETLEKQIETGREVDGSELRVKDQVEIAWKIGRIVRQTAEASMDVVKMERLLLGEPTEIVGNVNLDAISDEEAIREIEEAYLAAQRVKQRRELVLVAGGKANGKANGHANGKSNGSNGAGA